MKKLNDDAWTKIDDNAKPKLIFVGKLEGPYTSYVNYFYSNGRIKTVKTIWRNFDQQ